jgi:hypothetical protein
MALADTVPRPTSPKGGRIFPAELYNIKLQYSIHIYTGVFILENIPPTGGGKEAKISADVI